MSQRQVSASRAADAIAEWAQRIAGAAALLLPLAFLYSRAGAEILIGTIDALFLARCAAVSHRGERDTRASAASPGAAWAWARAPWAATALIWWAWMVLCSSPVRALGFGEGGGHSLLQAALLVRFVVLAGALADWLLRDRTLRRFVFAMIAASAAWIAVQCWQQYIFGRDLSGWPRWSDGALTGPFRQPRAGPALVLILFPAVLPITASLLRHRRRWLRGAGILLFALAISTMVLIGQRMPALLTGLGLAACGIALPRLRPVVAWAAAAAAVLLVATPFVSPPTFQKLVVHFAEQMHHFPQSPYGQLYVRATVMGLDNPATGLGFDGFRDHCLSPAYQHGLPALGISDTEAAGPVGCSIHPHNHYLEAFTSGGWPGLIAFCAMVAAWLAALARGLVRGSPRQVGCFITVLLAIWPFASTSAFFTLPNAGWLFLALGAGLAEAGPIGARARAPTSRPLGRRALALTPGD